MQKHTEIKVGAFVLIALAVLIYMGFEIGAFRFDMGKYASYILQFDDISGLARKAEVKIAGVKIGWVEDVFLIKDHDMKAEARVKMLKDYVLYADAYGIVRQEGLLGPKYVEIMPGDPMMPPLERGSLLSKTIDKPVDVDQLMRRFDSIAQNVEDITESMSDVIGGVEGREQLQNLVDNLEHTTRYFADVGNVLQRALTRNEDDLDAFIGIGTTIQQLSEKLENDVFPSFQESIEKISDVFDRDFNRIALGMETTTQALERAANEAQEGLTLINNIVEKIDRGDGLLGKIINEDDIYRDAKIAMKGFKKYVDTVDRLQLVFDSHFETMLRPAENYEFEDAKGYFDVRIHPNEHHFYLFQLATSERGFISRKEVERNFVDPDTLDPIDPQKTDDDLKRRVRDKFREQKLTFRRNTIKIGLQFGTIFKNVALRMGLFEGMAGFGVDVDVPFRTDNFRWVTSLEMFDFNGWNRKRDRRPHVKWLNRIYMMRNIYFTFGADDFASKRNANVFFGGGIRFGDDDVKYLVSGLSGVGGFSSK